MKIVCAWCGKTLQEGKEPVSHGICADCAKTLKEETNEQTNFYT